MFGGGTSVVWVAPPAPGAPPPPPPPGTPLGGRQAAFVLAGGTRLLRAPPIDLPSAGGAVGVRCAGAFGAQLEAKRGIGRGLPVWVIAFTSSDSECTTRKLTSDRRATCTAQAARAPWAGRPAPGGSRAVVEPLPAARARARCACVRTRSRRVWSGCGRRWVTAAVAAVAADLTSRVSARHGAVCAFGRRRFSHGRGFRACLVLLSSSA